MAPTGFADGLPVSLRLRMVDAAESFGRVKDGTIKNVVYDSEHARLVVG